MIISYVMLRGASLVNKKMFQKVDVFTTPDVGTHVITDISFLPVLPHYIAPIVVRKRERKG